MAQTAQPPDASWRGPRVADVPAAEATPRPVRGATSLLDDVRVGTLLLDLGGRVLLCSGAAELTLGRSADSVLGTDVADLLFDPTADGDRDVPRERLRALRAAVRRDGRWAGVLHVRRGRYVPTPGGAAATPEPSGARPSGDGAAPPGAQPGAQPPTRPGAQPPTRPGAQPGAQPPTPPSTRPAVQTPSPPPVHPTRPTAAQPGPTSDAETAETAEIECRAHIRSMSDGESVIVVAFAETDRLRSFERDLAAFDALFGSSPLGIAFFDTRGRYVRVNEALAQLNGLPADEHVGRTVHDVLSPAAADEIAAVQQAVLRTGESVIDLVMATHDGGSRSVSYSRLTDHIGRPLGVSCTVMDISERRDALEKVERSRQRLALLDHVGVALGDLLEVRPIAGALAEALVPRFADHAGVLLSEAVERGDELPGMAVVTGSPLQQLGSATRQSRDVPTVHRMLRVGQDIPFRPGSFFARALVTGIPHLAATREELLASTYPGDPKIEAALELGIHSLMALPLRARGIVLGLLVVSRSQGSAPFDRDDLALATELADRAGISLDNARLYAREREAALTLQRALLPQHVPTLPGVRVAHRYIPGSAGAEVGGDWFDEIPLAGGRVALVVGDVMGHGLRAAATMGRLRTAVRTLAGLDLPPDELLRRVNDLTDDLSGGPDDTVLATCVYAVYDPSTRRCSVANAGHVPPVLLTTTADGGRHARTLNIPTGAPLGVGGVPFEAAELETQDGTILALYTDGLVERRGEDITEGLDRLIGLFSRPPGGPGTASDLEATCDEVIAALAAHDGPGADDAALLLAQLGDLPEGSSASWTFSTEHYAVRRARSAVRSTLREWDLEPLVDAAVLLVSELVTNSLRYARGPVGVRMVRGSSLLVEVSDPLPDPPRARVAADHDEGGRGIQLVARESRRWGTRHGPMGKTVWFELALPG